MRKRLHWQASQDKFFRGSVRRRQITVGITGQFICSCFSPVLSLSRKVQRKKVTVFTTVHSSDSPRLMAKKLSSLKCPSPFFLQLFMSTYRLCCIGGSCSVSQCLWDRLMPSWCLTYDNPVPSALLPEAESQRFHHCSVSKIVIVVILSVSIKDWDSVTVLTEAEKKYGFLSSVSCNKKSGESYWCWFISSKNVRT